MKSQIATRGKRDDCDSGKDAEYMRRLIMTNENLKAINKEIVKNEQLNQMELQSTIKTLRDTRIELENVIRSYEELKAYKAKLENSLNNSRTELADAQNELSSEKEKVKDYMKKSDLLSSQFNSLNSEMETLKGSCKALKREKEVLMATYCRVMKENDKLRGTNIVVPDQLESEATRSRDEIEFLKKKCKEWEVENLQESVRSLEELKNEYMVQVELLHRSSGRDELEEAAKRLELENRDLIGALAEESKKRKELDEMCVKLDKARRALKEQIQFIRDENERVLDSVKKQIKTEFSSSSTHTPMKSNEKIAQPSFEAFRSDDTKVQELIDQVKDDLRQAAAISSPGGNFARAAGSSWERVD